MSTRTSPATCRRIAEFSCKLCIEGRNRRLTSSAISNSIFKSVADVAGEITTQYILRYIPENSDPDVKKQFRTITVKVALANVKVRARKGYYPFTP